MQEALLLVFIGVGRFFMNSVLYKWAYVSTKLEELLSKHISFPLHTHPYRHICSHLYRSKKVYESKGHRFESCPVHHKPPMCFAPLAVFLFAWYCWKIPTSRPVRDGPRGGFLLCVYLFFSGHQTNYHKSYHIDLKTPPIRLPAAMMFPSCMAAPAR